MKRIITPIPAGLHFPPAGAVAYDGHYDFIAKDDEKHEDAIYAAVKNGLEIEVLVDKTEGMTLTPHEFAGWGVTKGMEETAAKTEEEAKARPVEALKT